MLSGGMFAHGDRQTDWDPAEGVQAGRTAQLWAELWVGDFHIQRAEVAAADGISYSFPTLLLSVNMLDTWVLEGGVIFPQLQEEMNAVNI